MNFQNNLAGTPEGKELEEKMIAKLIEVMKEEGCPPEQFQRFSLNPDLLDMLIGWEKESILKAKNRLMDLDFSWANNVEKFIPIFSHRPSLKDKISIIRAIQESREL